jgi:hypothetical protein
MLYSAAKLDEIMQIWRGARVDSARCCADYRIRKGYNLRQAAFAAAPSPIPVWHGSSPSSSGDEYSPSNIKGCKKRVSVTTSSHPAKKRRTSTSGEDEVAQTFTDTTSAVSEGAATAPFLTLQFGSQAARNNFLELAETHRTATESRRSSISDRYGDGGLIVTPHVRESTVTELRAAGQYTEQLDAQSSEIDNKDGRVLRNRKIFDEDRLSPTKKCLNCSQAKAKYAKKTGEIACAQCVKQDTDCCKDDDEDEEHEDVASSFGKQVADSNDISQTCPPAKQEINGIETTFSARTPAPKDGSRPDVTPDQSAQLSEPEKNQHNIPGSSADNAIELESSPEPEVRPQTGKVISIQTWWAHPMDFRHTPTQQDPCHFCNDFRYGVFGCGNGQLNVTVIKYPNNAAYEEMGDGHCSQGKEPTRMCVTCALRRLHISRCQVHLLLRFDAVSTDRTRQYVADIFNEDFDVFIKKSAYRTCSLCFGPGLWRCCTDQRVDKLGRKLSAEKGKKRGCGLILCEDCRGVVMADGIVRKSAIEKKRGPAVMRADLDFLFPGSLLHKAYSQIQA